MELINRRMPASDQKKKPIFSFIQPWWEGDCLIQLGSKHSDLIILDWRMPSRARRPYRWSNFCSIQSWRDVDRLSKQGRYIKNMGCFKRSMLEKARGSHREGDIESIIQSWRELDCISRLWSYCEDMVYCHRDRIKSARRSHRWVIVSGIQSRRTPSSIG